MPASREQIARVLKQIDAEPIAANTLRLIKEPSPTLHEEAASKLCCNMLREYGLEAVNMASLNRNSGEKPGELI